SHGAMRALNASRLPFRINVPQKLQRFMQIRLEVLTHQIEDLADGRVAQRVEYLIAVLASDNDLLGAQNGEVLRGVGLFEPELLVDAADGHLAFVAQQFDDGDARRVPEGLKDSGLEAAQVIL